MLKKRNRLSRREFEHLLKHGRRVHGEGVTVVYEKLAVGSWQLAETPQTTSTPPPPSPTRGGGRPTSYQAIKLSSSPALRASVVVGKKVARNAVDRNKLRRAIYGVLEEVLVRGGVDGPPHLSPPLGKGRMPTVAPSPLLRGRLGGGGSSVSEPNPINQSLHLAILTRPKARTMTAEELRQEIGTLLARCRDDT